MKNLFLLIPAFFLFGCNTNQSPQRSFCYWQSNYSFDDKEMEMSDELGLEHFYIRFFDIAWSAPHKAAIPVGETNFTYNTRYPVKHITPAVYITNRVFSNINKKQIAELARKTAMKIQQINENIKQQYGWSYARRFVDLDYNEDTWQVYDSLRNVADSLRTAEIADWDNVNNEILIDCDWTETTQQHYFDFLRELKKEFPQKQITSTLRLWQYRHPEKSGVPPVKKCLLMCYNIADVKDINIENSIAMPNLMKPYFEGKKYPLELDFALPVFSWNILFRYGQFVKILHAGNNLPSLNDTVCFEQVETNKYRFLRDTVIGNSYLRFGDIIRTEQVSENSIRKILNMIEEKENISGKNRITFFSWDTLYIEKYKPLIKEVYEKN